MKKLLIAGALLALAGGAYYYFAKRPKGADTPRFQEVQVERGDLFIGIQATGGVEPQNRVAIRPPLAGRVEEVLVAEGDWVKRGQILAWLSSSERAALLDAARARGPEELKRWSELYKATPLVAPITGTIIARSTQGGQSVSASDAVLVVADRLIVKAQVDETDIARVQLGQKARITLDAYPDRKLRAKVVHIAFEARTVSNVTIYDVEVLPQEVPAFMRSGMTSSVEFESGSRKGVLLLPVDAVKPAGKSGSVRLPAPDGSRNGRARPLTRTVETGLSDGVKVEIVEGLDEGETVLMPTQALPSAEERGRNPFSPQRRPNVPRGARR